MSSIDYDPVSSLKRAAAVVLQREVPMSAPRLHLKRNHMQTFFFLFYIIGDPENTFVTPSTQNKTTQKAMAGSNDLVRQLAVQITALSTGVPSPLPLNKSARFTCICQSAPLPPPLFTHEIKKQKNSTGSQKKTFDSSTCRRPKRSPTN